MRRVRTILYGRFYSTVPCCFAPCNREFSGVGVLNGEMLRNGGGERGNKLTINRSGEVGLLNLAHGSLFSWHAEKIAPA